MDEESPAHVSPLQDELLTLGKSYADWLAPRIARMVGWMILIVPPIVAVIRKATCMLSASLRMLSASLSFCTGRVGISITPDPEFKFTNVDTTVLGFSFAIAGAVTGVYFQNGCFYAAGGVCGGGGSKGPDLAVIHLLLISISVSVSGTLTGAFLRQKCVIATFFTKIGLLSFLLQITGILWILLPANHRWAPLICGVTSLLALVASSITYKPRPMNSSNEGMITNP